MFTICFYCKQLYKMTLQLWVKFKLEKGLLNDNDLFMCIFLRMEPFISPAKCGTDNDLRLDINGKYERF